MSGWRPKLVALDLDGTVVSYPRDVQSVAEMVPSVGVVDAIERVVAAGVPVIVATGRNLADTAPTALALGLHGILLVCSNGALIYDSDARAVRHEATVDVGPAVRGLAARLPGAEFAVERGLDGFLVTPGMPLGLSLAEKTIAELAEFTGHRTRLICYGADHTLEELAEAAAELLDPADYNWQVGRPAWLDVMAPDVSKASGVAVVADDLGVDQADVLAIGDGHNDLALFGWAGHAVAMGQAADDVKAAADSVTDHVDADGVVTALGRWFP